MASGKGKVSKNSRTSKKAVQEFIKKVRPKKETILVEVTEEVMDNLSTNTETGLVESYLGKPIIGTKNKFGKKYLICSNV